jgi:hypothetical protein
LSIKDTFRNLLYSINKSGDLTIDFERHLDDVNSADLLSPYRKKDWIDLVNAVVNKSNNGKESDVIDNVLSSFNAGYSQFTPSKKRLDSYKNILAVKDRIPILGKALRIWADNILSPDDINKRSLNVISELDDIEGIETEIDLLKQEFRNAMKVLAIDKKADYIIQNTLLFGDFFVELTTRQREMENVFGGVIREEKINLSEINNKLFKDKQISVKLLETEDIKHIRRHNLIENDLVSKELREYKNDDNITEDYLITEDESNKDDAKNNKDDITYDDVSLIFHQPHNVIKIQRYNICLGYLVIDSETSAQEAAGPRMGNVGSFSKMQMDSEKEAFNTIINKVYAVISSYLKQIDVNSLSDDIKDVLINIIKGYNKISSIKSVNVRYVPESNMIHFKNISLKDEVYGESIFADLEFIFRLYLARLVSSTIYMLSRAGKHMIFTVDVSGTRDASSRIENVKRAVKSREVKVSDLNDIETIPSIVSTFEDYYLPAKDGKRYVEMDTLDMGSYSDTRQGEDTTLIKNILTGIEIPPSYLGIEEFNSTKATLAQESMLFARSVIRYQKMFSEYFTELMHKIYILVHSDDDDLNSNYHNISLTFMPPRGIITEALSKMYTEIRDIYNSLKEMNVPEEKILRRFLPEYDFDEFYLEQMEKSREESNEEDMGGGELSSDLFGGEETPAPETP